MKKMSKNAQLGLVIFGLAVYAALGHFMLVGRQSDKVGDLQTQVAAVEAQITETRAANARAAAAIPTEPVRVADLFRLSKAMPDQTDMPGVLLELNRVARETGIEFDSIVPGGAMPDAGFQIVPIDLVFEGNFYDLTDFLYRTRTLVGVHEGELDARGRLFNVDTIDFAEGKERFPQIRAALRLEAYVFGTGQPATTTPPAVSPEATTPATPNDAPAPPVAEGAAAMGATP